MLLKDWTPLVSYWHKLKGKQKIINNLILFYHLYLGPNFPVNDATQRLDKSDATYVYNKL